MLTDAAREANLTNERGVDGTTRLLKNVMGLWLEQECARVWDAQFGDLHALARAAPADVPLFDPDDERFLRPATCRRASRPPAGAAASARRATAARRSGRSTSRWPASTATCSSASRRVSGRDITSIHVIGGGARSELLCRLTADITGRPLLVGPIEATALGNVLVQARAAGELASLADMREVARRLGRARPARARARPRRGRRDLRALPRRHRPGDAGDRLTTWTKESCERLRRPSPPRLKRLSVETPSWGYGDSGTRFATFPRPAARGTSSSASTTPPRCTG